MSDIRVSKITAGKLYGTRKIVLEDSLETVQGFSKGLKGSNLNMSFKNLKGDLKNIPRVYIYYP